MTVAKPADASDRELVARCRRGDTAAWEVLVRRYQRLVYAIVTRMGLDEHLAADVFQTVFARLVEHLPRLAEPDRLQAWIVTTAKREGLRQRGLVQRHDPLAHAGDDGEDQTIDIADDSPRADELLGELQQLHQLRRGLERLDSRCRDLLQLLFPDDDDPAPAYDEVARRLAIPIGSIGPTRQRCLGKLRQLLAGN